MSFPKSNSWLTAAIVALALLFPTLAKASSFPDTWLVRSEYEALPHLSAPAPVTWRYTSQASGNETIVLVEDANSTVRTNTEMYFNSLDQLYRDIAIHTIRGKERRIDHSFDPTGPALFPESLAPADWLNLSQKQTRSVPLSMSSRSVLSDKTAVAAEYTLERTELSVADALANDMLDEDLAQELGEDPLSLYSITDERTGDVALIQLWASDGSWWLYESTATRKSWRIK